MDLPEIRYATSGDVSIAYSVVGDGPIDLVFVSGWVISNFGAAWEGTTGVDRGGHFAAMEEPDLLVGDVREFFRLFR